MNGQHSTDVFREYVGCAQSGTRNNKNPSQNINHKGLRTAQDLDKITNYIVPLCEIILFHEK